MHFVYLHGFASSPRSSKARFFAERLREAGRVLHCPDLNVPAFEDLTITRMLRQAGALIDALPPGRVAVIGSSLGALVAVQLAARHARIDRLLLLAPALDFDANRRRHLGEAGLERWKSTDRLDVYHFGEGATRRVRFDLYNDACSYDCYNVPLSIPVLIFHGHEDAAVDPATAQRFASGRPNVTLQMLQDDHQLLRSLPAIWAEAAPFLGLGEA